MRKVMRLVGCSLAVVIGVATAPRVAQADVCIAIDEPHDTLSQQDRTAALLLVAVFSLGIGWQRGRRARP
jgi:hypothetical protein